MRLASQEAREVPTTAEERATLLEACSKDQALKKALEELAGSQVSNSATATALNFYGTYAPSGGLTMGTARIGRYQQHRRRQRSVSSGTGSIAMCFCFGFQ